MGSSRLLVLASVGGSIALAGCRDIAPPDASIDAPPPQGVVDAHRLDDGGLPAPIGPTGGQMDHLVFGIVGDTRPVNPDDTAHYPSDIIAAIWGGVEADPSQPGFAISTGDYMFASTGGNEQAPQLEQYLAARAHFTKIEFPAIGNHECTGYTSSNCGAGAADGITKNYQTYQDLMLAPLGLTDPWYVVHISATDGSWTAKLVFVAANAWNAAQASWLEAALGEPTTYTFVVRHEGNNANTAPGVDPSNAIIAQHPLTMLICGHTHTLAHYPSDKELIVGNGGAPLTSSYDYGYVIVRQRGDGRLEVSAFDYATRARVMTFVVKPDGSPST